MALPSLHHGRGRDIGPSTPGPILGQKANPCPLSKARQDSCVLCMKHLQRYTCTAQHIPHRAPQRPHRQFCVTEWLEASHGPQPQVSWLMSASDRTEVLSKCTSKDGREWWEFTDQLVAFYFQLHISLICQPPNFGPAATGMCMG